jgi:hypothetical protein
MILTYDPYAKERCIMKDLSLRYQIRTTQIAVSLIFLSCFFVSTSSTQERKLVRVQDLSGSCEILTDKGETTFPFELIRNQIVIPVEMKGSRLNLILDSGMPAEGMLLFGSQRIDDLKLQYVGKARVMGVGGQAIEADMAAGETASLPGMLMKNQMVIVMPHDSIRSHHFEGKDGIIGFSLLSRFVVKIDYDSMQVTLIEPEKFQYSGAKHIYEVAVENNRIFLPVSLRINQDVHISADLVLDTGNGAALILDESSTKGIVVPEKSIVYTTRSINDEIPRHAGRISAVQLGDVTFDNVLCSFRSKESEPPPRWQKDGNLGNELLRRFNMILDIPNKRIMLEPNHHVDEPFKFNMAGFQVIRSEHGHFRITHVIPDSPASQSGLEKGDQIVSINGKPSSQYTYDDSDDILTQERKFVQLVILSSGKEEEVRIELRQLI